MKVLLVNSYDRGGAAQACIRLHLALLAAGIDCKLLLLHKSNAEIPQSFQFTQTRKPLSFTKRFRSKIKNALVFFKLAATPAGKYQKEEEYRIARTPGLEGVGFPYSPNDITTSSHYQEADIINLHWVADFLDWSTFFKKNTKPVVWTLHDQNPFLGANHYPEPFYSLDENGYPLKREISQLEVLWETNLLKLKEEALRASQKLVVVAPSRWMYETAKSSKLLSRFEHLYIPYGIDISIFKPLNKAYSRSVLNMPEDAKILLFVADAVESIRKGYQYLEKALQQVSSKENIRLFAIGRNSPKQTSGTISYLGPVFDQRLMAIAYSAADVFVIPSLEDNLPNTVIESLCCGTPIAGFNVGGLPDMVTNGLNGFLSDTVNVSGLLQVIEKTLSYTFDREGVAEEASRKYEASKQAKSYIELYHNLVKG